MAPRADRTPHEQLLQDIQNVHVNATVAIVCLVIWVCEVLHTLPAEVALVWRSNWGLSKALYFLTRIGPLTFLPFMVTALLVRDPSPKLCQALYGPVFTGDILTVAIAEAILCLRLYALSGCNRKMRIFLVANWTAVFIWLNVFIAMFLAKHTWDEAPQTASVGGCKVVSYGALPIYIVLVAVGIMYNGLVTMGLSIYFGWKHWGLSTTPFMKLFFRDGMIYFVGCTGISVLNSIGALTFPEPYDFIFAPVQGFIHSILAARMVLMVKERAREEMGFSIPLQSQSRSDASWRVRGQGHSEDGDWSPQ